MGVKKTAPGRDVNDRGAREREEPLWVFPLLQSQDGEREKERSKPNKINTGGNLNKQMHEL